MLRGVGFSRGRRELRTTTTGPRRTTTARQTTTERMVLDGTDGPGSHARSTPAEDDDADDNGTTGRRGDGTERRCGSRTLGPARRVS